MTLIPSILEAGFASMIATKPTTAVEACDQIAAFYFAYASTAQAAGIIPGTFTGTEQVRFSNALKVALDVSPPNGTPAQAAAAFVAAMTTFWLTPPVIFGVGAVVSFAGAGALQASLVTFFSTFNDAGPAASQLATALDTATRTVEVLLGIDTFLIA